MPIFDAGASAGLLPYLALAREIERVILDTRVQVPSRLVLPLPDGGSLFVMPAHDGRVTIAKVISFTPGNAGTSRPTIQGDVLVFELASGERVLQLDGPTVTARRTAAVSLLAAQRLARSHSGALLIVGAGVQGRSHLEAFAAGLQVERVIVASRSESSASALVAHARSLGLRADATRDADAALADCAFAVTCTPADAVVLRALPRDDAFIAAVGAFTPRMAELAPELVRHIAARGSVVVDCADAVHEAGDLLQAGIEMARVSTLADVVRASAHARAQGPVLFKSCGWAGWDLAAARLAFENSAHRH